VTHLEILTLNYLLNSLWQIPIIFLAATLAARLTRSLGSQVEHRIWVGALLLEVALPACDFARSLRGILLSLTPGRTGVVTTQTTVLAATEVHNQSRLAAILAFAALAAYAVSLCFVTARLIVRLYRTRNLFRTAQPVALTGEPLAIWNRCTRIFDIPGAHLAASDAIVGPSTIGIRRRIILLPALLASLSHEDLAAALAHEFAHMRRRDFAKNLLYELAALPIAWHPLFWLTRLRIAESREMVCDDLAAQATHGTTRYAHSLLRLAASCTRPASAATVHAIGILDANILERRVMKLTQTRPTAATSRRIATAGVILLGAATCATAMTLRLEVPPPAIITAPITSGHQQPNAPIKVAGGVLAGQIVSKVNPVYPQEAREQGIEGAVVLHAIIGRDGTVQELTVASGPEQLQASALEAVKQWVYKPYLLNGEPTEVETTITVNYSLAAHDQPGSNPRPQADNTSQEVLRIGGSVLPPVVTYSPQPQYPESARKAKLSGNVVVALIVDQDGIPRNVQVARGMGNEFDEKAVEAVQQYRFKPATQNGEPVPVNLKVEVNFQMF
jgi:TonB family protein